MRRRLGEGVLGVRQLSQGALLAGIVDLSEGTTHAEASLTQLQILTGSVIFLKVWTRAGHGVLRRLNGEVDEEPSQLIAVDPAYVSSCDAEEAPELEVDSDEDCAVVGKSSEGLEDSSEIEDDQDIILADNFGDICPTGSALISDNGLITTAKERRVPFLDLASLFSNVIPLALERWDNIVERILSGTLPAREASTIFRDPGVNVEREVRLLCKTQTAATHSDGLGYRSGPGARVIRETIFRVSHSLAAYDSIDWMVAAVPALLHAHVSLFEASSLLIDEPNAASNEYTASTDQSRAVKTKIMDSGDEGESNSTGIFAVTPSEDPSRKSLSKICENFCASLKTMSMNEATTVWESAEDWVRGEPVGHDQPPPISRANDASEMGQTSRRTSGSSMVLGGCRSHVELLAELAGTPVIMDWLLRVRHLCRNEFRGSRSYIELLSI